MKLEFEGRTWSLELLDASVSQAESIIRFAEVPSLNAWYASIGDPDGAGWLKSMRCLYWLMKAQNGEDVDLPACEFAPMRLLKAFGDASAAETKEAAEAEEDPTKSADANAAAVQTVSPATSPG